MVLSDTVAFDDDRCDDGSLTTIRQFEPKATRMDHRIGFNGNRINYISASRDNCKRISFNKNACNQTYMSGSAFVKCLFYKSLNMSASVEKFRFITVLTIILILCTGSALARPNGSGSENTLDTTTKKVDDVSKVKELFTFIVIMIVSGAIMRLTRHQVPDFVFGLF